MYNYTGHVDPPTWDSPAWKVPSWFEPLAIVSILFGGMWITRRRGYSLLDSRRSNTSYLDDPTSTRSSDELLAGQRDDGYDVNDSIISTKHEPKQRSWCGIPIQTPNTSRFRHHFHSRILQKFPFLIEMFYWIINWLFYKMTKGAAQTIFAKTGIWNVAQAHGLAVLDFEEFGPLSWLFPLRERDVQQWFFHGHMDALEMLNRTYALIHIPGTVGFIVWYYYVAPSHSTFAVVRRTMTLTNFMAFTTFILYPCMPPRLLPEEYGFFDTVSQTNGQSVWQKGDYVNALAAMPSMHFGYSCAIGCTLVYHSGLFRRSLEKGEFRKSAFWKLFYLVIGAGYPLLILTTIVATANHYFMDVVVATLYLIVAFFCNKVFFVFIPLEDWLLWILRLEKPIPSTGDRFRERGGRI